MAHHVRRGASMTTNDGPEISTAAALQDWRAAEQAAAVSRRGRLAAESAAFIAAEAADAAMATAESAKVALEAATLAEASAAKTAAAARALVEATGVDVADATSASDRADVAEGEAKNRYGRAIARAQHRGEQPGE